MKRRSPLQERAAVKWLLIGAAFAYIALVLLLPLGAVFAEAFRDGVPAWLRTVAPLVVLLIALSFTAALAWGVGRIGRRRGGGRPGRPRPAAARPAATPVAH